MRQSEWVQTQWTRAKRYTARKDGDFWNTDGLYPTADRQQLRRSPGWSSFTAWSQNFKSPCSAFYNAGLFDDEYFYFVGEDEDTDDLAAICYTGGGWNTNVSYASIADLVISDTKLRGLHQRDCILWYSQDLFCIADSNSDVYKCANLGAGASIYDGSANDAARMLVPHGDRLYLITETGEVWYSDDSVSSFTQLYDPAPFLNVRFAIPTSYYLLLFTHVENGTIQLFHLPFSNPERLLPIDTIPNVPCHHPIVAQVYNPIMPWATNGEDVYFSSGHFPMFDNPTIDIYKYNGSRVEKVAELDDLANPTSKVYAFGLTMWHGELLAYQIGNGETWIRMLVGDQFVDFVELSSTAPWSGSQAYLYCSCYNLAGWLFLTGKNSGTEGFIHAKGYTDGNVISSWLDMDHPGLQKRLNRLTAHIKGHSSDVTVTISYRADGATSWTPAAATANSERIVADNIAATFYRLQVKIAIADVGSTPADVRIDSLSVHYTMQQ